MVNKKMVNVKIHIITIMFNRTFKLQAYSVMSMMKWKVKFFEFGLPNSKNLTDGNS